MVTDGCSLKWFLSEPAYDATLSQRKIKDKRGHRSLLSLLCRSTAVQRTEGCLVGRALSHDWQWWLYSEWRLDSKNITKVHLNYVFHSVCWWELSRSCLLQSWCYLYPIAVGSWVGPHLLPFALISVLVDLAVFTAFHSWSFNAVCLNSSAVSAWPRILTGLVQEPVTSFPLCGGFEQCNCSPSFSYRVGIEWGLVNWGW